MSITINILGLIGIADYANLSSDKKFMIVPHHSWATGITNIEKDAEGNYVPVSFLLFVIKGMAMSICTRLITKRRN